MNVTALHWKPVINLSLILLRFYLLMDVKRHRNGGGKRDRTADLLHAMQALSQLSYTPESRAL